MISFIDPCANRHVPTHASSSEVRLKEFNLPLVAGCSLGAKLLPFSVFRWEVSFTVCALLQIFMHGNNLNSLHQLIHPEILPSELGGMMPPYDMGTWARTLLEHAYDEETDYSPESYTLSVQDLERDLEKNLSPKTMKRSVLDPLLLFRAVYHVFTLKEAAVGL